MSPPSFSRGFNKRSHQRVANSVDERFDPRVAKRFDLQRVTFGALIILLHVGFFYAFNNALVQHVDAVLPKVLMTMIVPAAEKPAEAPKSLPQKSAPPVARTPEPPAPKVDATPQPTTVSNPAAVSETSAPPGAPAATEATAVSATGAAATAPAAALRPATPETISGVEYLQPPQPDYPPASRRQGEQGEVQLRVLINAQGRAEQIVIVKSSRSGRLDEAARQAVMRAIFKPHLENGRPMAVFAIVPISFQLD